MTGLLFIVVLAAVVAAAVFAFQARSAAAALQGLQDAAEASKKEAEAARAKAKELDAELKTRGLQLAETRERLTESRKKSQEGRTGSQKGQSRGAREAELEEDLLHSRGLTEQAHAAEIFARKEAQAAKAEAAVAEGKVSRLEEKVRELSAQAREVPKEGTAVTVIPAAVPQEDPRVKELETARRELLAKVATLEEQGRLDHKRLVESREEMKRSRGRAETNNRVYLVTKSELELIKERLANAERRLWQSGIPLTPVEQKPRPKGSGPASVEKIEGAAADAAGPAAAAATIQADAALGAPAAAEVADQPSQDAAAAPVEELPSAAVAGPSDEVLQRIGGPKRRRPAREEAAPPSADAAPNGEHKS